MSLPSHGQRHKDEHLVTLCLDGDPNAWETLVRLICNLAQKALTGRSGWSHQDVEDLVQQVCVALLADDFRILRRYDQRRARLHTFLAGVLVREVQRYARRHFGRECGRVVSFNMLEPVAQDLADLDRITLWHAAQEVLAPVDVLILRLTAWGYRAAKIADVVARIQGYPMTAENVRKRRQRAVARLRDHLHCQEALLRVSH